MHWIDWTVLGMTLLFIVGYGAWKTRNTDSMESYLLGDRDLRWWTIGLSIMATQASGITFLSTPGQAYEDGMRFIQFYFGLPVAMVLLSIFVIPIYYRLKVYTAYEYLEGRFDVRARTLASSLFLIQRGFAAGLTIYAPSIIMSSLLGWNLGITNLLLGGLVVIYTVIGGTKAVSETQQQQMFIIITGLFVALGVAIWKLPADIGFADAVQVAGKMGKVNLVDFSFEPTSTAWWDNRYNFWTGMIGGTFLFLSYFGTDQSQVQRYLSGKSLTESRLGLMFNGLMKVPMQFIVLFVGAMVFVFYQFEKAPLHFNSPNVEMVRQDAALSSEYDSLSQQYTYTFAQKGAAIRSMLQANKTGNQQLSDSMQTEALALYKQEKLYRLQADTLVTKAAVRQHKKVETNDTDYVFINFVTKHLPIGIIGLLIAVIFAASMSSTSSELNALATTSVMDIYRRLLVRNRDDNHYLKASRYLTLVWGAIILCFAMTASLFDNLIQAVNIVGSLFYGVILGIFVVAFFMKRVGGTAVFIGGIISELLVITIFILDKRGDIHIAYLWLNLIGCVLVMLISSIIQLTPLGNKPKDEKA